MTRLNWKSFVDISERGIKDETESIKECKISRDLIKIREKVY